MVQGIAAPAGGDIEAGIALLQQARRLLQEAGDDFTAGIALGGLSGLALFRGEMEEAERYAEENVALAQRTGDALGLAYALDRAAVVALVRQDLDQVRELLTAAIPLAVQVGQPDIVAYAFMGLAVVAAVEAPVRAVRLCGAAERLVERAGVVLWPTRPRLDNAALDTARAALGTDAFDAAWAEGRAMTREQAVAYALAGEPVSV